MTYEIYSNYQYQYNHQHPRTKWHAICNRLIIGDNWRWFLLCWITSSYFNLFLPHLYILIFCQVSILLEAVEWVEFLFDSILLHFLGNTSWIGLYFDVWIDRTIFWCMNRRLFKVHHEFFFFFFQPVWIFLLLSLQIKIWRIMRTDREGWWFQKELDVRTKVVKFRFLKYKIYIILRHIYILKKRAAGFEFFSFRSMLIIFFNFFYYL